MGRSKSWLLGWETRALVVSGSTLFAGTNDGVFISSDSGTTWTQKTNGLTNPSVASLAVDGNYLYAGTYEGGCSYRQTMARTGRARTPD